jgi:hypothetical protein
MDFKGKQGMMNQEQVRVVAQVYREFLASEENRGWEGIDDYLETLQFLDDDQLGREAEVVLIQHRKGKAKCDKDHPESECFVPKIIEAVQAILDLVKETGHLHKNNRYILEYYLAVNQAGMIQIS